MAVLKKIISILLRISVSLALLIFLFRNVDRKTLLEIIKHCDKGLLFWAFLVFFFNYLFCLIRWIMLLKEADIHLPLSRIIISFSGGIFFNLFLPSAIGGDVMRSIDLAAHTRKPKEIVSTVILDRLSGSVGLVILILFSLPFGWNLIQDRAVFLSVSIIIVLLSLILLILFNDSVYSSINRYLTAPKAGRFRSAIKNLHQEMHGFKHKKVAIITNLFVSVLVQANTPITFYLIALAIGLKINLIYFFVFIPIIGAITMLPISIGGLGLRDATTIYFFAKAGVSRDSAFAMSLLNFSFILVYGVIGGLIYVLTIRHRRIQHHLPRSV
jgi:uncharacterized protein (TIRG00374 family)